MSRSTAREVAMQLIYEAEMGGDGRALTIDGLIGVRLEGEDLDFTRSLLDGVLERSDELEAILAEHLKGWTVERLSRVDSAIMRLALLEMLHMEDIPVGVSIDEAVELAHKFSTPEASALINGVLGSVARSRDSA